MTPTTAHGIADHIWTDEELTRRRHASEMRNNPRDDLCDAIRELAAMTAIRASSTYAYSENEVQEHQTVVFAANARSGIVHDRASLRGANT